MLQLLGNECTCCCFTGSVGWPHFTADNEVDRGRAAATRVESKTRRTMVVTVGGGTCSSGGVQCHVPVVWRLCQCVKYAPAPGAFRP